MSVAVQRDALHAVARQVSGAVSSRNTIPILGNVLLEIGGGVARLTGTDLECQVTAECAAEGALATTLPAEKLVAALDGLRPGQVTLAPGRAAGSLVLKQGRSTRTLPTLPVEDFPRYVLPEESGAVGFTIDAAALGRIVEATQAAQFDDPTRPILAGIYLHVADGRLRAVATDAKILLRADTALPEGAAEMPGIVVPSRSIALLRKLILRGDAMVEVRTTASKASFAAGAVTLATKLIEGRFPDYDRIIPAAGDKVVRVGQAALIEALNAVSVMIEGEGKARARVVRIGLSAGAAPELSSRDQLGAEAIEPLDAEYTGAEATAIGVNARLMSTVALMFREASALNLHVGTPQTAVLAISDAEPDLLGLCMPTRIAE